MKTINGIDALMGWGSWGEMRINKEIAAKYLESKDKEELLYLIKAFNHELGHANHQAVCKDYEKMGNLKELNAMFIKDTHYYDEFMKDIKGNKVVKNYCTDYALTSPAEFVADVFAEQLICIFELHVIDSHCLYKTHLYLGRNIVHAVDADVVHCFFYDLVLSVTEALILFHLVADKVVDQNGGILQMLEFVLLMFVFLDEKIVLIHLYAVAVGVDVCLSAVSGRVFADIKCRTDFKEGLFEITAAAVYV